MAKRLGRTIINDRKARQWAYQARNEARDKVALHGACQAPVVRQFTGMQDSIAAHFRRLRVEGKVIWNANSLKPVWVSFPQGSRDPERLWHVDALVPCRKCEACLKRRAAHWRARAIAETQRANRTWFATLTLSPSEQFKALARARQVEAARGNLWEKLSSAERFSAHCKQVYGDFQKYLKRLRKGGAILRYVVVFERHTGGGMAHGMPHLHALIHETSEPVRHRALQEQWQLGFSSFKLVDDSGAHAAYVCKYLTKEAGNKVRASLKYGLTEG